MRTARLVTSEGAAELRGSNKMKSDPQMSFLRKQESTLLAFSLDSRVRGSDKE